MNTNTYQTINRVCLEPIYTTIKIKVYNAYRTISKFTMICIDLYKIIVVSLLSVFIPQTCPESTDGICTIFDNVNDLTIFNKVVLAVNVITLVFFTMIEIFKYLRELIIKEHFKEDNTKSIDNLKSEIVSYPILTNYLTYMNNMYYKLIIILSYINAINIILSCFLVLKYYYLNSSTIMVLLVLMIIIKDKLSILLEISSISKTLLISSFISAKRITFNTINTDKVKFDGINIFNMFTSNNST